MIDLQTIIIPFTTIFFAEFLDKSQLSILLLSSKIKNRLVLLIGVILAFIVVDGTAIIAGSWISSILPTNILRLLSGIAFIIFGFLSLKDAQGEKESKIFSTKPLLAGFLLVFLAEWGDKTQIASAVFATRYPIIPVLIGVLSALSILAVIAVYVGDVIAKKVDKNTINRIAGFLFIATGIFFFFY